jgi:xanthine dehydrogenase accessory factor
MNEVEELVDAFDAATMNGERCALATVVSVDGSSYRRPGARMLVSDTGAITGSVSAGCLESDVIEHCGGVIRTAEPKLLEYDTGSTGDELAWELGLGCGGTVRVLLEPLVPPSPYIEALRRSREMGPHAGAMTIATVYRRAESASVPGSAALSVGGRIVIDANGHATHERMSGRAAAILEAALSALPPHEPTTSACIEVDGVANTLFVETLLPPVRLIVFGAGPDALPVIELARDLGWRTEIVDPQARPTTRDRFAMADRVVLSRPEDIGRHVSITPRTFTLLMSHNYSHDLVMLGFVLESPAQYIGVMGPRHRTERMLSELGAGEDCSPRLYAPVGLDIRASGPREIALSVVAEMQAVLGGRDGGMLRERGGAIHGARVDGRPVTSMAGRIGPGVAA